jgi:tetratricopeptide (TPR) repeat protein
MSKKNIELSLVIFLTLVLYWPSFQFDFVNFDDQVYVLNNTFVQSPSFKSWLDGSETGNFHPLTMLTLRLDQVIGNGQAGVFHMTNVLWHLLNTILVYLIVSKMLPQVRGGAFFVALMFGIHPMHVESVAWISSRKDVVYGFFFLLSMLSYWEYLKTNRKWLLMITLVTAILSFLGKPASIVLPLVLGLVYYLKKERLVWKELFPIGLLLLGSIAIGIATLQFQSGKSINNFETYSLLERGMFALYGIGFYTLKSVIPVGLSPMHPYPSLDDLVTTSFIGFLLLGLLFLIGVGVMSKKNKWILFSGGFFLLGLILTLQLVSIGRAIVSERYTYIAYVGLFFLVVVVLNNIEKIKSNNVKFYALSGILGLPFFFLSMQYLRSWQNSETLWSKAIQENPDDWYAYIGRGNYYEKQGLFNNALTDFKHAVSAAPDREEVYYNLGDLQFKLGFTKDAIITYSAALNLNPTNSDAYVNRGQFYVSENRGDLALSDFNHAIQLDSNAAQAYINRGNLYLLSGNRIQATSDFTRAIKLDPLSSSAWYNRGTAEIGNDLSSAEQDLLKAVELDQNYFDAYNNLGSVYYQLNDLNKAEWAFTNATNLNPSSGSTWLNLSVVKNQKGDHRGALECALQAKSNGVEVSGSYLDSLKK